MLFVTLKLQNYCPQDSIKRERGEIKKERKKEKDLEDTHKKRKKEKDLGDIPKLQ